MSNISKIVRDSLRMEVERLRLTSEEILIIKNYINDLYDLMGQYNRHSMSDEVSRCQNSIAAMTDLLRRNGVEL